MCGKFVAEIKNGVIFAAHNVVTDESCGGNLRTSCGSKRRSRTDNVEVFTWKPISSAALLVGKVQLTVTFNLEIDQSDWYAVRFSHK